MNKSLLIFCFALIVKTPLQAQVSKFQKWVTPSYFRGFNIVDEDYIGNSFSRTSADFIALKKTGANFCQIGTAGFDSIKAPYNANIFIRSRVDSMVKFASKAGLYYTIAVRTGPGRVDVSDESSTLKSTIWTTAKEQTAYAKMLKNMALRYMSDTLFVGLNLLVEPTPLIHQYQTPAPMDSALKANGIDMKALFKLFIDSVRKVDQNLPLIVQAVNWSDPAFFGILQKQLDAKIIYDVHCYTPFEYSHDSIKDHATYPGIFPAGQKDQYYNRAFLDTSVLKLVKNFQALNKVPVYMGEFGMRFQQKGGENYLKDLESIAVANGWPFSLWAYNTKATFDYDVFKNSFGLPYMNTVKTFFTGTITSLATYDFSKQQATFKLGPFESVSKLTNLPDGFKTVSVYNVLGQKLHEENTIEMELILPAFDAKGIYSIRVESAQGTTVIKAIF